MATAMEVLVRLEGHEKECTLRYKNIEKRLDDGAKRFSRLEMMLWGRLPFHLRFFSVNKTIVGDTMSILASLVGPVTGLLDKFIEDKDTKNALAHEIATMSEKAANENAIAQIELNKAEAQSGSLFIGGWRPFVGWTCGIGLAYNVIISQVLSIWFEVPTVDPSLLTPVLMGMLGMGAMRSYEKTKNVAREK
jgi:hypothetical protein